MCCLNCDAIILRKFRTTEERSLNDVINCLVWMYANSQTEMNQVVTQQKESFESLLSFQKHLSFRFVRFFAKPSPTKYNSIILMYFGKDVTGRRTVCSASHSKLLKNHLDSLLHRCLPSGVIWAAEHFKLYSFYFSKCSQVHSNIKINKQNM